jgi:hypothetical protein
MGELMRLGAWQDAGKAAQTLCRASQSTIASRNEGLESTTLSVEMRRPHSCSTAGKAGAGPDIVIALTVQLVQQMRVGWRVFALDDGKRSG